jgi:hypothetical protein
MTQIVSFWEYVSNNINSISIQDLKKDLQVIEEISQEDTLMDYVFKLTPSGMVFAKIKCMLQKIDSRIVPLIGIHTIEIPNIDPQLMNYKIAENITEEMKETTTMTEQEFVNAKKLFMRFHIVVSGSINYEAMIKIEKLFENAPLIESPDWIVIKYSPPTFEKITIPFKNQLVKPEIFKFRLHSLPISPHHLDLIITVDDEFCIHMFKKQEDVDEIIQSILRLIESIMGEYFMTCNLKQFSLLPITEHNAKFPNMTLQNLSELASSLEIMLPEYKKCKLCGLANHNTPIAKNLLCNYCNLVQVRLNS